MPRRRLNTEDPAVSALRVAKTIGPNQNGAKRHALKHGDRLVCVRHRIDPVSNRRFVTIELVAEVLPIASRDNLEVAVRIGPMQKAKRVLLLACGATWDGTHKVWRMPRSVARTLRLLRQVVENRG